VLAVIATGVEKFTCCQPVAVSPVNVAVASKVAELLQRCPMWVPVLFTPLKNRTPVMNPLIFEVNLTPNSNGSV
jgi:hypothetical protein